MTEIARIAVVGRPNVGKSTLTNRIARSRVSIVEPTAGVTRDRVFVRARIPTHFGERWIEVIDTGGVGIVDRDDLGPHVEEQIRAALLVADVILFVVDARDGITPLDREVARRLHELKKPILLVCNKVESEKIGWEVDAFRELGVGGEPIPISAQNGDGMSELFEEVSSLLPPEDRDEPTEMPVLKLAVIGRRNAGKSTLVNALAREERSIVSEVPGTTRDALDVIVERNGETICLIDTAGIRKRRSHEDAVEFFSDARSKKAIRRADVVVLLFDATQEISSIEKKLARYVKDHYRPVVLAANKWDLVKEGIEPADFEDYLAEQLPGIHFAPVIFLSAKEGLNVQRTFTLARELFDKARERIVTSELNRVLQRALEARSPSSKGHRVRVKYATQADTAPPTFVLFVNDKRLIGKDYLRYLENRVRQELGFEEVPVRFVLRDKREAPVEESY